MTFIFTVQLQKEGLTALPTVAFQEFIEWEYWGASLDLQVQTHRIVISEWHHSIPAARAARFLRIFAFFKAVQSFRLWFQAIYMYCNYSWIAIHGIFISDGPLQGARYFFFLSKWISSYFKLNNFLEFMLSSLLNFLFESAINMYKSIHENKKINLYLFCTKRSKETCPLLCNWVWQALYSQDRLKCLFLNNFC